MQNAVNQMLQKYSCKSLEDYTNALKEIIQEIALLGLWRSKFFEHAAFYGGTALRIFHQLNRFSEDLDFSLLSQNETFKLEKYNEAIITELQAFGFEVEIISKVKNIKTNIDSITLKANTKLQLLNIFTPESMLDQVHHQNKITIKMEVDIDPPLSFNTEAKVLLNPIPFEVNIFQLPDLFATKIHAILCRKWQTRVKGRDWFDLIWYVAQGVPLSVQHLEARLIKSGEWAATEKLKGTDVMELLITKIHNTDYESAKNDVMPFISDIQGLKLWSSKFFQNIIHKIIFVT